VKYRPEVDGLRAVAILPVVLFHAGLPGFSGGFVGVDVFFVISGYLISSIILLDAQAGKFSLLDFYKRRIRRIFPALFVMMAVCYPVAFAVLGPTAMQEFSGSVAASTAFFANIYFLNVSGYFETAAELKPLLHNWSLSVEEQFYMIFPAFILLTWRFGGRAQVAFMAVFAIVSITLAQWQIMMGDEARAFFLLQTRIWELLVGALVAYWLASERGQTILLSGRFRHVALLGLVLIVFAVAAYGAGTLFPGFAALLPCLGAAAVISFATPQNLVGRILCWQPMVFVGLISYSLYLWHYPLFSFIRISMRSDNLVPMLAGCVAAFLLAYLSWRFVEKPVRKATSASTFKVFGGAAIGILILGLLGLSGHLSLGYRSFYIAHRMDAPTRANYEKYQPQAHPPLVTDEGCTFAAVEADQAFQKRFEDCANLHGQATLVLGDSHAGNIYRALRASGRFPFVVALFRAGCRPYAPKPGCPYEAAIPFLARNNGHISRVIFHVSGSHLILDHLGKEDTDAAFAPGSTPTISERNIGGLIAYLQSLPAVQDLVWLGPFAEARVDFDYPENFSPELLRFSTKSLSIFQALDETLKARVRSSSTFRFVSLVDALKFNTETLLAGECMTFSDVDHFSSCGEALFGPVIATALN
jgi:peptidoglycan/LPS O-acetylase OafA/YrhL